MKVLSCFDGMSCGQIALERAGIPVEKYYASEINKYAITATMHNYPDTIQLGDIKNIRAKNLDKIDLIIGGSPCQGFSRAGKGLNFNDPRSALFFEFVRLLHEVKAINPNVLFLLENVRMNKEHELIISQYMGVNPVMINSALVSAQNRERLYWCNFNMVKYGLFDCVKNEIPQPKDKKIFLRDILEPEVDEKYFLSDAMIKRLFNKNQPIDTNRKARTFTAGGHSGGLHSDMDLICISSMQEHATKNINKSTPMVAAMGQGGGHVPIIVAMRGRENGRELGANGTGKSNSLTTVQKDNLVRYDKNYIQWDFSGKGYKSQQDRAHFEHGKMGSIPANRTENKVNILLKNKRIRRLTPLECCRLQTVPDNYFYDKNGKQVISDTRIYECLGNGWTVDVIVHLFSFIK